MSIQPRLLYRWCFILIITTLSGCAARGKAGPAGRSEVQREAAVIVSDKHPTAVTSEPIEGTTLEHYLQYAALHNPELGAAFNRWKASLEMIPQVTSLPDPQLTYTYDIREVDPQRHKIDIAQMFPWRGTRDLRGEVVRKESQELREKFEALKTNLFYKVKLTYFEYYFLSREIDITQKNLDLMTALEQSARIK